MLGKKALRLATAALMVGVALGAQQASGATLRHAAKATYSGVISITDWQFPSGCNLVAASSKVAAQVCSGQAEDSLFLLDDHLTYRPDLAQDIPTTTNGEVKTVNGNMVVTYKLKPNLKWSDGSAITPADLIFSVKLDLIFNPTGIDQIQSMKMVDDRTWEVTYKGQYAPYVAYGNPSPIFPQKYFEKKYGTTSISAIASKYLADPYTSSNDVFSGAFKIQSWTKDQSVVLVPNPYYTALPATPGHPRPAQLKFVVVSQDEATLAQDLQSSSAGVDQAEDFQINDLPALQGAKSYNLSVQPALEVEHLEMNEDGVLHDVRLRQALQYAIDKHALFHDLFPSISNINDFLLHTVLANASPYTDLKLPVSEFNPAKAKALLKAAGYSTDYNSSGKHLLLRFATTSATTRQKAFGIIAKDWAAVGVHVSPYFTTAYGNNGLFDTWANNGVLYHGRFDVSLFAYSTYPDPQQSEANFDPKQIPGPNYTNGNNQSHIRDQDQFNLLAKARHAIDAGQRQAILNQWQKLTNDRVYWIMLYARTNISVYKSTFGPYKPNPSQATNEWNAFQWYAKGAQ